MSDGSVVSPKEYEWEVRAEKTVGQERLERAGAAQRGMDSRQRRWQTAVTRDVPTKPRATGHVIGIRRPTTRKMTRRISHGDRWATKTLQGGVRRPKEGEMRTSKNNKKIILQEKEASEGSFESKLGFVAKKAGER